MRHTHHVAAHDPSGSGPIHRNPLVRITISLGILLAFLIALAAPELLAAAVLGAATPPLWARTRRAIRGVRRLRANTARTRRRTAHRTDR